MLPPPAVTENCTGTPASNRPCASVTCTRGDTGAATPTAPYWLSPLQHRERGRRG